MAPWRRRLYVVIFEADTTAGRLFDLALLVSILASVLVVMLESVESLSARHHELFLGLEWFFTIAFTTEYVLRLLCVARPLRYAVSFFGVVDLLAILPAYLSLLLPGTESLLVIRALRLLRIFRVLKLTRFLGQANMLTRALRASSYKVIVFLGTLFVLVVILGTAVYIVEGPENGFDNIPESVYWAIVTITTVGYGDMAPVTPLGKALAATAMILGYAIIAVPTGIVTAELVEVARETTTRTCPSCLSSGHLHRARFCRDCGAALVAEEGADAQPG